MEAARIKTAAQKRVGELEEAVRTISAAAYSAGNSKAITCKDIGDESLHETSGRDD